VVEHTAHNGFVVGSNPTKLNALFYKSEPKPPMSLICSTTEVSIFKSRHKNMHISFNQIAVLILLLILFYGDLPKIIRKLIRNLKK
jgi:hypothetical protein